MSEDERLERWFDILWNDYPLDLCQKKKGSKQQALKSARKLNPDEKLQSRILGAMREMARVCRLERKQEGKTDRWPFISTWINQARWEMLADMETPGEMVRRVAATKCGCGQDTAINSECWGCYDERTGNKRERDRVAYEALKRVGLGKRKDEDKAAWNARCREYAVSGRGLGRLIGRG